MSEAKQLVERVIATYKEQERLRKERRDIEKRMRELAEGPEEPYGDGLFADTDPVDGSIEYILAEGGVLYQLVYDAARGGFDGPGREITRTR